MNQRKTVVVGIDGMSPGLFNILVKKKIFSTLAELKKTGAHGKLQSVFPPTTAPAWTTFATGVNPGKHGIYDFVSPRKSLSQMEPISSEDIVVKTFYELLEKQGKKSILVNLPVSWPPLTKNPTITSLLTQSASPIYPRDLIQKVPALKNYQVVPEGFDERKPYSYNLDFINAVRKVEKIRFESCMELLNLDWDLFFVLFSGTDWLSHYVYDKLLTGTAEEIVWQFFAEIDQYIAKIYESTRDVANIFVLSDHGFQVVEKQFGINQWLAQEGLLKRKGSSSPTFSWLLDLPLLSRVLVSTYEKLKKHLGFPILVQEIIDPAGTVAFSTGWGIYLNSAERFVDGIVPGSERKTLAKQLKRKLEKLKEPQTGERVFKKVFLREELYSGREVAKAPDIMLIPNKAWQITAMLMVRQTFGRRRRNDHDLEGIFLANGSDIVAGEIQSKIALQDVPATILYVLAGFLPKYLDGRIIPCISKI